MRCHGQKLFLELRQSAPVGNITECPEGYQGIGRLQGRNSGVHGDNATVQAASRYLTAPVLRGIDSVEHLRSKDLGNSDSGETSPALGQEPARCWISFSNDTRTIDD